VLRSHTISTPQPLRIELIVANAHADHICCVEKATWWGCGNHVPSVLDQIPEGDRCACEPKVEKEGKMYPPKGPQPEA